MVGVWSFTGQRAGDGRAHARALRRDGPALPVAAGRGRPRERARDLGGRGRRQEPHVQRPHGHVVLRAASRGSRGVPGFQPEAFVRDGTPLRARHLEHEGRARLLRRGASGRCRTPGCGCAATCWSRPSAARSRRRSRATRSAPSTAATRPARATSSRTAASRTCASSASRRRGRWCSATSGRSGSGSGCTGTSSTRRSARAGATRTRSCASRQVLAAVMEWVPTWEDDPSNGYRGAKAIVNVGAVDGRLRLARLAHAAPRGPVPRRARAADEADGGGAARGARHGARARGAVS